MMMRENVDASVAEKSQSSETTFLFTSESVGEGHPGENSNVTSWRF